jgi:hypothetical protein
MGRQSNLLKRNMPFVQYALNSRRLDIRDCDFHDGYNRVQKSIAMSADSRYIFCNYLKWHAKFLIIKGEVWHKFNNEKTLTKGYV